ncbi:metal ABC transporter permease [Paenibacillus sp. ATY16]|uniref:metal ABC transporter permease n=1 Tax=Paenibacillus sp. ATY16 TaxID=1759312 RepID=UPI00200F367D|nr:metal ABC transporter permease [Paenibacillus sp. ATY16]MCK9859645.1 metal ABC transporter permease [Paenibacillus sp. ATY16]
MEMLHYDFMQRAFWAGGIIAILASTLGVYLMLRRQALIADMLSHVSLAGVAAGTYLHINPSIAGFIVAMLGAIAVEYVRRSYKSFSEVSVAIIMVSGLASAVVLMSLIKGTSKSLSSYLFGSVVAVNTADLWQMIGVAVVGAIFFFFFRRPLYQISFDEETAKTDGLPVKWISLLFSIMTGMIVSSAMPIVGVLLVSALVILPAAFAVRIAVSFSAAIGIACAAGLVGVFSGLTASYHLNTPPGGTIAIILLIILGVGVLVQKTTLRARSRVRNTESKRKFYTYQ